MPQYTYRDYFVAPPWTTSVDWAELVRTAPREAWEQLDKYPSWLTSCGVVTSLSRDNLPGFDTGAVFLAADGHVYVVAARKPEVRTPRWFVLHLEVSHEGVLDVGT